MKVLKNKHPHLAGQKLNVNGTKYQIDGEGLITVSGADADKLLAMPEWSLCEDIPEPQPEPQPDPDFVEKEEMCTSEDLDIVVVDDDDEDEWPEPNSTMKKPYLQDMARAYGIDPGDKTKMQLIMKIKSVMFE